MIDSSINISRYYSTKGSEKKLLVDALKAINSSSTKRRRLKKVDVIEEKNVKVKEVTENKNINPDVAVETEKIR